MRIDVPISLRALPLTFGKIEGVDVRRARPLFRIISIRNGWIFFFFLFAPSLSRAILFYFRAKEEWNRSITSIGTTVTAPYSRTLQKDQRYARNLIPTSPQITAEKSILFLFLHCARVIQTYLRSYINQLDAMCQTTHKSSIE